ncbi:MAG TPA: hypothetical protein VNE39_03260 [Planctomycetota bacterium]|nr:hypothetical protein [Planctomycetota bacterium]
MEEYSRLLAAVKSIRGLPSVVVALCITSSIVAWSSACATIQPTSIILSVGCALGLSAGAFWVVWQATRKQTEIEKLAQQVERLWELLAGDKAKMDVFKAMVSNIKETQQ